MTTPLEEVLVARGYSANDLAVLDIPPERAHALLAGADPTIEEVRRIAAYFKLPIRSLITPATSSSAHRAIKLRENFRSRRNIYKDQEVFELLSRAETLVEIIGSREQGRIRVNLSEEGKQFEAAERLASFCRMQLFGMDELEPIINLDEMILYRTNALILLTNQRYVEGGVIMFGENAFIAVAQRPDPRMRFTLAHEFCHYLVDFQGESELGGWFDEDATHVSASQNYEDESFANAFASALLLPATAIGQALNRFRRRFENLDKAISDVEVVLTARFFGVSFQVAARRFEDLRLLPRGGGQALYESISKRFGSPEKFAERYKLPKREASDWQSSRRMLLELSREAVQEGKISIGRLAEVLDIDPPTAAQILSR